MKKIIFGLVMLLGFAVQPALADGHGWGGHGGGGWHGDGGGWRGGDGGGWRGGDGWRGGWGGWGDDDGWVVPTLLGGAALGYMMSQPQAVYVQPPPVYAQPQATYVQTSAPQGSYAGAPPRAVYQQVVEYNAQCNCNVLVQRQVGWQ
ncbi:MAG: hypothetical protein M0Z83_11270 [Betaproteobacteria bacterium]|nr:hypothetical protein [Betaproteobacteria bacterium]